MGLKRVMEWVKWVFEFDRSVWPEDFAKAGTDIYDVSDMD